MESFSTSKGFTLIELLAVMVALMAVGTVIGSILFSSLRGTSKTDIVNDVKQNGYFAIAQMTKMLRFAKSLNSLGGTPYPCPQPTPPNPIPTVTSLVITSFDGGTTTFDCSSGTIASNGASLLDTSVVETETCSFTCRQDSSSNYPIIDINFSLKQKYTGSFVEKIASSTAIPFQTSVSLRNVSR